MSERHVHNEATRILHRAEKATGPDVDAANKELQHDKQTMTPKEYGALLKKIAFGDHKARQHDPHLPTVFVLRGEHGKPDKLESWVMPK
jgi:hypothetical protein